MLLAFLALLFGILPCLTAGLAPGKRSELASGLAAESSSSLYKNSSVVSNSSHTSSESSEEFQYKGVALGRWLVLEPYITPSLFLQFNETNSNATIPKDEFNFCKKLGKKEASRQLHEHWSDFYNALDFEDIKRYGFNMVRIPIGYWAFDTLEDDPYVKGAEEYLDRAIEWASDNDLKVWIDLHGAPGSQNGFDNSGLFRNNTPHWQDKEEYVNLTLLVLRQIYTKYGSSEFSEQYNETIIGIEVLNEPFGPDLSLTKLKDFYRDTYEDARDIQDNNNTIVFHDAFQSPGYWNDFKLKPGNASAIEQNYNILIDHHHYGVFSVSQLNNTMEERIKEIKQYACSLKKELSHHPNVVGEWSAALTDCAPWVNSVGWGTRWEGTHPYDNEPINNKDYGSCANINNWLKWSKKHKMDTRKLIEIQLDQYTAKTKGWIFWCYKTETTIEWDFKRLAELGLFPQPFTDRQYIFNGTDSKPDHTSGASAYYGSVFIGMLSILSALII